MPICQEVLTAPKPSPPGYPAAPRTLGERLRRRRMDLGMSKAELARGLGVDPWTVLNWEKSRTQPAAKHLSRIWEFLEQGNDPPVPRRQEAQGSGDTLGTGPFGLAGSGGVRSQGRLGAKG